jgi:hypothetical protein
MTYGSLPEAAFDHSDAQTPRSRRSRSANDLEPVRKSCYKLALRRSCPWPHGVGFVPRAVLRLIRAAAMLTTLLVGAFAARAQTPWYEGFEGPEPTWQAAGGDAQFRVLAHQRVHDEAFTGRGCEHLAIAGNAGTHVYFAHDVGRPRVIDELLPTVRVKSDREGLQLLARVVLPRTKDPQSGRPLTTLVHGSTYTAIGRWQQLRIEEVPQQLARRTRVLRAEFGPAVDPREAYVDGILLNVYGGPGVTHLWIDDLDIGGYVVGPETAPAESSEPTTASGPSPGPPAPQADTTGWTGRRSEPGHRPASPRIELVGSVLLVDGRPFFPRIIQHRGEPLALIERLGFNTVWLDEPPSSEILDESARLNLWLVCPPPSPTQGTWPHGDPTPTTSIGPGYERVLAWDLGRRLPAGQLDALKQRAAQLRAVDRQTARPLICGPTSDLRTFSRYVDVLMVGRSPLGTSLELAQYGTWLRERPRLAQLGKALWTTVQTQPDPSVLRQWAALGLTGVSSSAAASSDQIRLLTYTAVTAGVRGLLFESQHPLDATDAATRNRALALELINLELMLMEPWLAAGDVLASVLGSQPEVHGGLLRTDRARLLVPVWSGPDAQYVPTQSAAHCVSLVVPGVPESDKAFRLVPGALEPLRPKRVTGGTRVTLDEFGLTALVLLTGEPLVISEVRQRAQAIARRAAQLQRELAAAKLQAVEHVHPQCSPGAGGEPRSVAWLAAAREGLRAADAALASRDYATAYKQAQRAMRPLRLVERADWEPAVKGLVSPVSHPAAISFDTLPAYGALAGQIASAQPRASLIEQGRFDDLETMLRAGWCHFQRSSNGVDAEAELAAAAAHSGRFGLRLAARPAAGVAPDLLIETPPCWITSPGLRVEAGQLVCIHGWVHVPTSITGSVDGLLIVDSLAGEPLAERIRQTTGWQEFTLYRMAAGSETLTVTFALSGLGEAWIDDVTIQSIPMGRPFPPPWNVGRLPAQGPVFTSQP